MFELQPVDRSVSLNGFFTAFEEQLDADYTFRGECHDFYELVLLLSGSVGITAGADTFVLETGTAVLHPPMEFHALRAAHGTSPKILIFTFAADAMPALDRRVFSLTAENILRARRALSLLREGYQMNGRTVSAPLPFKERERQMAACELELLMLTLTGQAPALPDLEPSDAEQNYRHALGVIEENLHLSLNTEQLARLCSMSPSLLKKLFSRFAGAGVIEYFRSRKINAAIPLLRAGVSVRETAEQLGFSDAAYFSTVFHRVTGHIPTYYKNH